MNSNLLSTLWPQSQTQSARKIGLVTLGVLLLAISAKVQVPFWPVPMTLQTLVVLLIGATAGVRLGGATLLAYLAAGTAGLPVFASGAGPLYMVGPTGGYLAGFLVAGVAVGYLADRGYGRTLLSALAMFVVGELLIFALGTGWLASFIGVEKAVAAGLVPFIPAEILKVALAMAILTLAWRQVKH
jgi:biotin transport system substrate-specific component